MRSPFVRLGLLSILVSLISWAIYNFNHGQLIDWDALGYYFYLPLSIIDGDIIVKSIDQVYYVFENYNVSSTPYQFVDAPNGHYILKYHIGQSILYLPFFLIGHLASILFGYPSDGFSPPYVASIFVGGILYHFMAFYFLAKVLVNWYKPQIVGIAIILLFWGTNAMIHLSGALIVAQGSLLFLISAIIFMMDKYYRKRKLKTAILAGITFGLIGISRPPDVLIFILILLWPYALGNNWKREFKLSFTSFKVHFLAFISISVFILFIQLLYWKVAGGSWIINGYKSSAEGFDFLSPYTWKFLFSFKTGWFIYTPLMFIICLWTVYQAINSRNKLYQIILLYLVAYIYIASSWSNYWYGGSFSQRAMIEAYGVLAFPLCGMVQKILSFKKVLKTAAISVLALMVILNIWQSIKFLKGSITRTTMTAEYYFDSFFDLSPDPAKSHYLAINHEYYHTHEITDLPPGYELIKTIGPDSVSEQLKDRDYFGTNNIKFDDLCPYSNCFVKQIAVFEDSIPQDLMLVSCYEHDGGTYNWRGLKLKPNSELVKSDSTGTYYRAEFFHLTPIVRNRCDIYKDFLWNRGKKKAHIVYLRTEIYGPSREIRSD